MVFRLARFTSPAPGAFIRRVIIVGAAKKLDPLRAFTIEKISSGAKCPLSGMALHAALATCESEYSPEPCETGAAWMRVSPGSTWSMSAKYAMVIAMSTRWVRVAPFGRPVVPLV